MTAAVSTHLASAHPGLGDPILSVVSPLVLADRLISLAQDADRAGLRGPASHLIRLAMAMCDEQPR